MTKSLLRLTVVLVSLVAAPANAATAEVPAAAPPTYTLGIGDALNITVFGRTDFVGPFAIGADGTVRLPLLGAVAAAGRTRQELEDDVRARLSKVLSYDAMVTADVAVYQPVVVFGDVANPGEQTYIPGMTALKAYARAGGTPTLFQAQNNNSSAENAASAERDLRIAQTDLFTVLIRRAALDAAIDGVRAIALPPELEPIKSSPLIVDILAREQAMLAGDLAAQEAAGQLVKRQKAELDVEIAALQAENKATTEQGKYIAAELDNMTSLQKKGLTTNQRLIELQQLKTGLEASAQRLSSFMSRSRQAQVMLDIHQQEVVAEARRQRHVERIAATAEIERARARIEGARMQLSALGQISIADLAMGRTELTFVVTRSEPDGTQVMEATGATPLRPGDVLEVHLRTSDHAAPSQSTAATPPLVPMAVR